MSAVAAAVAFVAAERLSELAWSERNTRLLRREGAVEHGRAHYPLLVALHAAWLLSLLFFVPAETRPDAGLLGLFIALQGVRLWALVSLGRFWTTRIISPPDAPLVARGPYRYFRHPNYAVVAAEIALLPLAFGAARIALVFSVANAALLGWRIAVEERALAPRRRLRADRVRARVGTRRRA